MTLFASFNRPVLGLGSALALTIFAGSAATQIASAQAITEQIGDGIVRFHTSEASKADRVPSMALQTPRIGNGDAPADFGIAVTFSRGESALHGDDRFVATIAIDDDTSLYGTGEAAGPLLRNGRLTECWNLDAYGYQDNSPNLYTSHPWVLAVRKDGTAFGVLADTTYRCEIDLREDIVFRADGPDHPVIVIDGPTPKDVLRKLGELTGTIEMPPKWALGYHQCRYSYNPDSRVREVAAEFRQRQIPADVIWMDIDYMDGFRCFTFDQELFPDPSSLNADLDAIGFQNVWMIDPGIKNEDGYFVHDQGDRIGAWVQRANGTEFTGEVWPGECVFPDFTNAAVREWWAGLYADFMSLGIDGVWNDMNEPSVFNVESKTMPETNIHRADQALGGTGPHARYHNVYGMLMIRASREGIMAVNPEKRPFVLSRANYIGGHRYGATWTGDNTSNWPHVEMSIPMSLNLSLSGQPFVGPDLGGFIDNGDAAMYSRWFGFGSLLPFARGHTQKGNIDKEPWSFGPEVEATVRRALERRYRLMPLLYTLFEESHRTGMPIARPLFFADPADPALRSVDNAFLLGENLLVGATTSKSRRDTYPMPRGDWRDLDFEGFDGDRDSEDPDQARLFVRAGGIVHTGPVHQHFGDRPDQRDELTLIVALDEKGEASGELYEDEGEGWGFREGAFLRTLHRAKLVDGEVVVTTETVGGEMPRPDRTLRVRVLRADGSERTGTGRDGEMLRIPMD